VAITGFKELLDRIKAEGELARENEVDAVGGMTAILELINVQVTTQTVLMKMSVDRLTEMNGHIKELVEDLKRSSQFADVKLADSVRKSVGPGTAATGTDNESPILDLLSLAGLTAGLIGAAIGAVKGQLKAINYFSGGLIGKAVSALQGKILTVVDDIGKSIADGFKIIRNTVAAALISVAQILDFSKDSKFLSTLTKISNVIGNIAKPFVEAFAVIKELIVKSGKVTGVFKTVSDLLGSFGRTVGVVAKIVGKLFAPVAIIMTAFDTIKGALDGYAEGGILGALEGAITGFVTSLVTVPLDLVKDIVSWIAGQFGFENFSGALDSFSFSDLFTNLIGGIFDTVRQQFDSILQIFSSESTIEERIQGLFDLIFAPIDAIKDLASSLTASLGLEDVAAVLDSFDISKMVTDLLQMISNYFSDTYNEIKGFFGFGDETSSVTPPVTVPMYGPDGVYLGESDAMSSAYNAEQNMMQSTMGEATQPIVESSAVTARQRFLSQQAEKIKTEAARSSTNMINAPTVNNVGGSTTNNNSSSTTIIHAAPHTSLDPYAHVMP
jgi:hypothetical protein